MWFFTHWWPWPWHLTLVIVDYISHFGWPLTHTTIPLSLVTIGPGIAEICQYITDNGAERQTQTELVILILCWHWWPHIACGDESLGCSNPNMQHQPWSLLDQQHCKANQPACHPSEVDKMSTNFLGAGGALHQRHSCALSNDANSGSTGCIQNNNDNNNNNLWIHHPVPLLTRRYVIAR